MGKTCGWWDLKHFCNMDNPKTGRCRYGGKLRRFCLGEKTSSSSICRAGKSLTTSTKNKGPLASFWLSLLLFTLSQIGTTCVAVFACSITIGSVKEACLYLIFNCCKNEATYYGANAIPVIPTIWAWPVCTSKMHAILYYCGIYSYGLLQQHILILINIIRNHKMQRMQLTHE